MYITKNANIKTGGSSMLSTQIYRTYFCGGDYIEVEKKLLSLSI